VLALMRVAGVFFEALDLLVTGFDTQP